MSKLPKITRYFALSVILIFIIIFSVRFFQTMKYPKKYSELVSRYSQIYSVPENIIYAVISVESGFDETAVSGAGAKGLMQLTDATYEYLVERSNGTKGELFSPEENIKYGTYYLSLLYQKYNDYDLVFCAYNAGPSRVDAWLLQTPFQIPFEETRRYVKKVQKTISQYEKIYS